jgi:membrane protein
MIKNLLNTITKWSQRKSLPGFGKIPIYDILVFVVKEIKRYDLITRANSIAFSFFMSLFPSLIALFTLVPFIKKYLFSLLGLEGNIQEALRNEIGILLPGVAGERLFSFIEDITQNPRIGLFSFGFFLALFFASNGMIAMIRGFQKDYSMTFKTRNGIIKRVMAIILTLEVGALVVGSSILIVFGEHISKLIGNTNQYFFPAIRWITVLILFYFSIYLIFRRAAGFKTKPPFFTPGTLLSTLMCLISSLGFSFYINHFNRYNELYGSIGTIIILMLWIQLNALFILIGYELNASIAVNRDLKKIDIKN